MDASGSFCLSVCLLVRVRLCFGTLFRLEVRAERCTFLFCVLFSVFNVAVVYLNFLQFKACSD